MSETKARDNLKAAVMAVLEMFAIKTYDRYRSRLWGAMTRLFNGGRDANFSVTFLRSIDQQLTEAWDSGAEDMGVQRDEQTDKDREILAQIINNETSFIERIMGEIADARDKGMVRSDFDKQYGSRCDLWANRYTETVNRARMQFGSKARMEWQLGATEEHCPFCSAYNGIVAFGYEWESVQVHPQMPPNPTLSGTMNGAPGCAGWRCDCKLEPTEKRRTARALDKLTQITTQANL